MALLDSDHVDHREDGWRGMTQPALSRLEAGDAVPTIPVLERISAALNAELIVALDPHTA